MFKGEAEVAWCLPVQEGEIVIALRVTAAAELVQVKAGERLQVTMGRTEVPKTAKSAGPQGQLSALAGRWCREATFQQWLSTTFPTVYALVCGGCRGNDVTERDRDTDVAAQMVRHICAVESRLELDAGGDAAKVFHGLIRVPYSHWLQVRYPREFHRLEQGPK